LGIIRRQGIKNTVLSYIGIAIGFVSLVLVQPRLLEPEEIGLTRVLFSVSFLISTLSGLGIGSITIKYFPQFRGTSDNHSGFIWMVLLFPILGTILFSLLYVLFSDFIISLYVDNAPLFTEYYFWVIPFAFFIALFSNLSVYSSALFKTTVPTFLNEVLNRALFLVVVLVYWLGWINLTGLIAMYIGIYLLQLMLLLLYIAKSDVLSLKWNTSLFAWPRLKPMLAFGGLFLFLAFASMGLKLLDTVVLGQFVSLSLVGVYAVAVYIPTFIEAPLNALDKIAGARIADHINKDEWSEIEKIYRLSSKYLLFIGGYLFVLVFTNIESLLTFLPEIYEQGTFPVKIISIGALFNLLTGSNNSIIFNSKRYGMGALLLLLVLLLSVVLLYVLIPLYGITGAAMAIMFSSVLYNSLKYLFIWRAFHIQPFDRSTLYSILLIVAVAGAIEFLLSFHMPLLAILINTIVATSLFYMVARVLGYTQDLGSLADFKLKL
jgi:O-antigen/teichoic acid export membrane protein